MPKGFGGRSPAHVLSFLEGIDFPCLKSDLVGYAEDKEAPDEIIDLLEDLPDMEYRDMSDVMSMIGQVE